MITPWPPEEARHHRSCATACLTRHDHAPTGASALEMDNCGACALTGRKIGDEHEPRVEGPNYAGWARVLVEAGRDVPLMWARAFARELTSDNQAYADALRRSIATFGTRGAVDYRVFECACERGAPCSVEHARAKCPCVQCVRLSLRAVAS